MTHKKPPILGVTIFSHSGGGNQEVHWTYWFQKHGAVIETHELGSWSQKTLLPMPHRKLDAVYWNAEMSISAQLSLLTGNKHGWNMAASSFPS